MAPPDSENPPAGNQGADVSTAIQTATSLPQRLCGVADHGSSPACPLHGCPDCSVVELEYVDPLDYNPPAGLPVALWESLGDLAENYLDEDFGCLICTEILTRRGWAVFPGWKCEMTCTNAHCGVCGLCGKSGRVCRICDLCVEHQGEGGTADCTRTRWSRSRRREVEFYEHELWNPSTGLW